MNVEFVPDKPSSVDYTLVAYTETEINALMSIFKQAGFE